MSSRKIGRLVTKIIKLKMMEEMSPCQEEFSKIILQLSGSRATTIEELLFKAYGLRCSIIGESAEGLAVSLVKDFEFISRQKGKIIYSTAGALQDVVRVPQELGIALSQPIA